MSARGQAHRLNVAFDFLRIYHFIFRRISHGATRLQEVLADRVAALMYGPVAFEEGLTHVVRQSVESHHLAFSLNALNRWRERVGSHRDCLRLVQESPRVDD